MASIDTQDLNLVKFTSINWEHSSILFHAFMLNKQFIFTNLFAGGHMEDGETVSIFCEFCNDDV